MGHCRPVPRQSSWYRQREVQRWSGSVDIVSRWWGVPARRRLFLAVLFRNWERDSGGERERDREREGKSVGEKKGEEGTSQCMMGTGLVSQKKAVVPHWVNWLNGKWVRIATPSCLFFRWVKLSGFSGKLPTMSPALRRRSPVKRYLFIPKPIWSWRSFPGCTPREMHLVIIWASAPSVNSSFTWFCLCYFRVPINTDLEVRPLWCHSMGQWEILTVIVTFELLSCPDKKENFQWIINCKHPVCAAQDCLKWQIRADIIRATRDIADHRTVGGNVRHSICM